LPRNGREKESRVRARVPWPAGILTAAVLPRASFLGLLPALWKARRLLCPGPSKALAQSVVSE